MIIPEAPPARGAQRSAHAQSLRKRTMIVVATLLLATAFVLAGAATTTAVPVFRNNHVTSILDPSPPCSGEKPGICPDSLFVQPN